LKSLRQKTKMPLLMFTNEEAIGWQIDSETDVDSRLTMMMRLKRG
jgi:hypothetical protein